MKFMILYDMQIVTEPTSRRSLYTIEEEEEAKIMCTFCARSSAYD